MKAIKKTTGKRHLSTKPTRPRKLGVIIRNDEFYSEEDLAAIKEGAEQIKRGECMSHDELKRLLSL